MIFHHNPIQIPSKSDSNPIQIQSNPIKIRYKPIHSDQVRSKSVPNPIQTGPNPIQPGPNPIQAGTNPDPDRSMATPGRIRMATPGRDSSELIRTHPKSSQIIANHESANRLVYPLSNPSV